MYILCIYTVKEVHLSLSTSSKPYLISNFFTSKTYLKEKLRTDKKKMNFSLRRSTRTRKNEVLDFQDPMPTKKRTLSKCKTDVKEQQNEHQQQEDYPVFTPHQGILFYMYHAIILLT